MTAYRFVTLTCDGLRPVNGNDMPCGEIHDPGMARTVQDARRSAASEGWRFQAGQDLCPRHFGYMRVGSSWVREPEDAS